MFISFSKLVFKTLTIPYKEKADIPVAVDRNSDDEQHGQNDRRDDDVERRFALTLVLHRANHPLSLPKFDLRMSTDRGRILL